MSCKHEDEESGKDQDRVERHCIIIEDHHVVKVMDVGVPG
jgi:hypothetical protein